jgi:hypothetical protein
MKGTADEDLTGSECPTHGCGVRRLNPDALMEIADSLVAFVLCLLLDGLNLRALPAGDCSVLRVAAAAAAWRFCPAANHSVGIIYHYDISTVCTCLLHKQKLLTITRISRVLVVEKEFKFRGI